MTDEERVDIIATNAEEDKEAEPKAPTQLVIPVLVPLQNDEIVGHSINNELKLSDFKLVLTLSGTCCTSNMPSEEREV